MSDNHNRQGDGRIYTSDGPHAAVWLGGDAERLREVLDALPTDEEKARQEYERLKGVFEAMRGERGTIDAVYGDIRLARLNATWEANHRETPVPESDRRNISSLALQENVLDRVARHGVSIAAILGHVEDIGMMYSSEPNRMDEVDWVSGQPQRDVVQAIAVLQDRLANEAAYVQSA